MTPSTALSVPHLAVVDGRPVTSSLDVADFFGKRHTHVLRTIENLEIDDEFRRPNFGPSDYIDSRGKVQPMFNISRKGFTILAMGFTGKEAMRFKVAYIEAFDQMESELLSLAADGSRKVVDFNYYRKTPSPSGLDIRYTLDLTKVILHPTRRSLALLERLTGVDLLDLEEMTDTVSGRETSTDELVRRFIAACLVVADSGSPRELTESRVAVSQLYVRMQVWYRHNIDSRLVGIPSMKAVSKKMYGLGLTGQKRGGRCYIIGVMLKTDFDGGLIGSGKV